MILADFHLHSEFSSDSEAPMVSMIERAIELGLKTICFTDHIDFDYPKITPNPKVDGAYLDFLFDVKSYVECLTMLRETYKSRIDIRIGVELGLQSHIQKEVNELMEQFDFDFVIGSSHLLYGADPYYAYFWDNLRFQYAATIDSNKIKEQAVSLGRNQHDELDAYIVKKVLRDYFLDIVSNIKRYPVFQVYGHLDYVVRYAPGKGIYYEPKDYFDILDEALKLIIEGNRGIEINTSALFKGLPYCNPHPKILRRYRELGGEIITVGSDAHFPEAMAYDFKKAEELLLDCGFRYYTTFKKKAPEFHRLGT